MDKLKVALERFESRRFSGGGKNPLDREEVQKRKNNRSAENLNQIQYTQTRIISIPSKQLIDNRVIAAQEMEPAARAFRMLRTKLLGEMRLKKWNTLAICSAMPDAGKSLVSANLAVSMALEANQSVLLVDLDFKRPSIHKYFSIEPEYGILDYLDGYVELRQALVNPGIERLVLLPGRKSALNSSEILSSVNMSLLIDDIKNYYQSRIVIFDLPPLLLSDDALVLLPKVDGSLLVVEEGKNSEKEIKSALDMLKSSQLMGAVLNKSQERSVGYGYYSYG